MNAIEKKYTDKKVPAFRPGDSVKVHTWIKEGDKERIQVYEGVVLARHNNGISSSFTVRKMSYGVGVERVFPLYSPFLEKIEVIKHGIVRRAKLYYLRERSGKAARIKERRWIETLEQKVKSDNPADMVVEEVAAPVVEETKE